MDTTMLAEIEVLVHQVRADLAALHEEFNEEMAEIKLRLERLEQSMAESNRAIVEQHHRLVACNAQIESIDARVERVENELDRRLGLKRP